MPSARRSVLPLALLGLLAILGPSCSSGKNTQPPVLLKTTPDSQTSGVPLLPNILFQFDRSMDPSFMTSTYFSIVQSGTTTTLSPTVEFLPLLNEVRITPPGLLQPSTTYLVLVSGVVQSSAGVALGADDGIQITTKAAGSATGPISFATPTGPGTTPQQITLSWSSATESNSGTPTFTYNVWMVSSPDTEDFLNVAPTVTTSAGATGATFMNLTSGQFYYFKVQAVDQDGNVYAPAGTFPELTFQCP